MSDLPPPVPGQPVGQPGWQPPAGPPPAPPTPTVPPADAPPPPPAAPVPPTVPPTVQMPTQPTVPMPTQAPQPPHVPTVGAPPVGGPKRSRVPAILGALVAVAVGFAAVLWLTRGGDDERSDDTEQPDESVAPTAATTLPETTVAETVPPTTVPLTLPTTAAPTVPPTTVPVTEPPVTVTVPANATPYTDPAGWTILVDPTWTFQQSPGFTGWFTNTGTTAFGDNVNVVTEDFTQPFTLDEYVEAAKAQILAQAADAQIMDERRVVGQDGVEVQMVMWSGTLPNLPTLVFLQAVTVTSERAYIATFTTEPGRMQDLAPLIGPFLSSIRPA